MASPQYEKLVGILWERRRPPGDHAVDVLRTGMEVVALPPGDDVVDHARRRWRRARGVGRRRGRPDRPGGALPARRWLRDGLVRHPPQAGRRHLTGGAGAGLLVDYRLAPEHPCPAGVDDAAHAYRWLLAEQGDPGALAIAGDSAGGGLTVATLLALRDAGVALPAAAVCISPWVDCALDAASIEERADRDPIVSGPDLRRFRDWYRRVGVAVARAGLARPRRPHRPAAAARPRRRRRGAARRRTRLLAERAGAAGVDVTLEVWPEMVHVWHVFAGRVPESTEAVEHVGAFLPRPVALVARRPRGAERGPLTSQAPRRLHCEQRP